jgi:hypothetical protein
MHIAQGCVWRVGANKAHFGNRCDVEMRDPAVPQRRDERRRRISLYGIKSLARKLFDKETGGALCGVRTKERNRLNRFQGSC